MYKTEKLSNNVQLITTPIEGTKAASLMVLIKVGSRQEEGKLIGISHFIEHLMFKGTELRPTTLDLSKELDGVGAIFNAYTGKEYTGYYIKSDAKHLSLSIDILSDMLLNSKFDKAEIEQEKNVIVEEINMYEDNPIMHISDILEETMYADHQLGVSIAGTRESVKGMTRDDFINFKNRFYGGDNIVISLAGKFDDSHIESIKNSFKFTDTHDKTSLDKISIDQKEPRVTVSFKETEQTQIALGFPGLSYTDKRLPALELLSIILGGNMSSRLFVSVRERNGLAYSIHASVAVYQDTGALVIQSGLDKSRIDGAIKLILEELEKIKDGVDDDELKRAKEYVYGKQALSFENSSHVSEWYAHQYLMAGELITPEQENEKISKVTNDDIKSIAKEIIDTNKLSLAVIGPFKDKERFENLLK